MKYRVHDLGRTMCGSLDLYALAALSDTPCPTEITGAVLRWARALQFLSAYVGETGALSLALEWKKLHPCPDVISVVNRHYVQIDDMIYGLQTSLPVDPTCSALQLVLESHALNLAGAEELVRRDLQRAQQTQGADAAHARFALSPSKSIPSAQPDPRPKPAP